MSVSMTLRDLLAGVAEPATAGDIVVSGLNLDSRRVRPGDAFIALKGGTTHGIEFASKALERGAVVVLAESVGPGPGTRDPGPATSSSGASDSSPASIEAEESEATASSQVSGPGTRVPGPVIWIDNLRHHLGAIAARFFDHPSSALTVIGVTGTNGKTSTVQMLAQALDLLGHRAASIGTLGVGLVGQLEAGERTTPDVISVHAQLAALRDAGASHVAMEASSHALDQHRVDGVDFDVAVFTNLTRDHLDYHGTMQAYGEAKARLFAWPTLKAAVVNIDDPFGRTLAERVADGVQCLASGIHVVDADVHAGSVRTTPEGLRFRLYTPWGKAEVTSPLLGEFNVSNLLSVVACLGALGESFERIVDVLGQLQPVPGRMSRLGGHDDLPLLVVDYAHTPDALEQALTSLREHCAGHLICVFGCGGERDVGKRPQMAAIAERLADRVIVTDDNPRGENGDAIVAAIMQGFMQPDAVRVERDRAQAIALALDEAATGDVVLVAGKGHETYQEVAGERHPFDDLAVARAAMEVRTC
ncbi:MAG TPA: UDP-N-acetylmuramoyl-L-alanyl-D-glutamate--2,6-diaminopimelate ligase [Rhodanobacteraceae bacterium]|nr:UDP-N-acetylmuramoyl-L-alanyl-D-glutamate--2,6-diaminopimelate ligase [Rhodanobacteraceae bacterium]